MGWCLGQLKRLLDAVELVVFLSDLAACRQQFLFFLREAAYDSGKSIAGRRVLLSDIARVGLSLCLSKLFLKALNLIAVFLADVCVIVRNFFFGSFADGLVVLGNLICVFPINVFSEVVGNEFFLVLSNSLGVDCVFQHRLLHWAIIAFGNALFLWAIIA